MSAFDGSEVCTPGVLDLLVASSGMAIRAKDSWKRAMATFACSTKPSSSKFGVDQRTGRLLSLFCNCFKVMVSLSTERCLEFGLQASKMCSILSVGGYALHEP